MSLTYLTDQSYYEVLGLKKEARPEEIAEAYRHMALKYHPKRASQEKKALYEYYFQKIAEAYAVLGDPEKRNVYDIYGKAGLLNGVIDIKGNHISGFKFEGEAHALFSQFMGATNPFTLLSEKHTVNDSLQKLYSSVQKEEGISLDKDPAAQPAPIFVDLWCTLEELYKGTVRSVSYERQVLTADGINYEKTMKKVSVEVVPGYDKSTVLCFENKGNEEAGKKTSALMVRIQEKPHPKFKRINKNDLIYTHNLTLSQALNSVPVRFVSLDGRKLSISMDEIISQNTIKKVEGEGMPILQENINVSDLEVKKGDLYIKFNIIFPEHIDPLKKQEITELLEAQDAADVEEEKKKEWKRNQTKRDKEAEEEKKRRIEEENKKEAEDKIKAKREKFRKERSEI